MNNSKKGIMMEYCNHNIINNTRVSFIGEEAVHFKFNSTRNTLQYSTISYTGLVVAGYGEGLYIGEYTKELFK